jgi:hypothetical protein
MMWWNDGSRNHEHLHVRGDALSFAAGLRPAGAHPPASMPDGRSCLHGLCNILIELRAFFMSNNASRRGASYSSAFAIILNLARERIAELGCPAIGENPKAFVERGGLSRLEMEAAEVAIRTVREASYPLIFKLFGSEMPRGKERKVILKRLGQDLARIEKNLGYRLRAKPDAREQTGERASPERRRATAAERRTK